MFMHAIEFNYCQTFTNIWTHNNQRNHDIHLYNNIYFFLPPVNKEFF